jgi:3-oxoacyl-[acyl-carrier protein] reductase
MKNAIVFGGSRGIGAAIARRLARDGANLAITYVSAPEKAAEVVAYAEGQGRQALAIQADSADAQAIRAAVEQAVQKYGSLEIAVINAGIFRLADIAEVTLEDLDQMLDVNVRGVFLAVQAAAAHLKQGGRIVTLGSNVAVRTSHPGASVYAMTKGAVATMVKGIAVDLAPRGITINNVQPGPILTDMTSGMVDVIAPMLPVGRIGQPEEIASLVAYLTGSESAYMTGSSLTMDGGMAL